MITNIKRRFHYTEWLVILGPIIALLLSCSNDLVLENSPKIKADSSLNFNFKALPDQDYYRKNNKGVYQADIELYLRMFQDIPSKTPVTLTFRTEHFGVLLIKKDTLYPDDQTLLQLSDFKNFRQNATFYTQFTGSHHLDFEVQLAQTGRKSRVSFETK